jgi:uncharacterized membrane protein YhiD involved in acid resistance
MPVELEMALRILLATALGGVIGFQRERLDKPAGFRTHILIAAGAALFTVVSIMGGGQYVHGRRRRALHNIGSSGGYIPGSAFAASCSSQSQRG